MSDEPAARPRSATRLRAEAPPGMGLEESARLIRALFDGDEVTVTGAHYRVVAHRLAPAFGARPGDPRDADVVIEAAGTEESWRDALALVRPGGTVLFFGGLEAGTAFPIDAYRLHYEELTLRGTFHHTPRHVRAALAFLASGAYPWERLITHEVGLGHVPALFLEPPDNLLKAAVRP